MKKIGLFGLIIVFAGVVYFAYHYMNSAAKNKINDYSQIMRQNESVGLVNSNSSAVVTAPEVNLTTMLNDGINTLQGVLQSQPGSESLASYSLSLNGKPIGGSTVSPIELVQGFIVEQSQVLLFGFDQGGNQCSRQYQLLTVSESGYHLSKVFGSCLPMQDVKQVESDILLTMPQNNPYLGNDITETYVYHDGSIKLLTKPSKAELRNKYANYTATKILAIAAQDGCYQDGVMLYDNSCANGRKYCTMFKNLRKPVKNADYKLLKSFCSQ
jgi:hypothetical protein